MEYFPNCVLFILRKVLWTEHQLKIICVFTSSRVSELLARSIRGVKWCNCRVLIPIKNLPVGKKQDMWLELQDVAEVHPPCPLCSESSSFIRYGQDNMFYCCIEPCVQKSTGTSQADTPISCNLMAQPMDTYFTGGNTAEADGQGRAQACPCCS